MISCTNLIKTYGRGQAARNALDGVDFKVEEGEFVAVIGSSGSGKTTLLNIIGGLDRPTSGKVMVQGKDLATLADGHLSKMRNEVLGFVFQHFNLLEHLSCIENITLSAYFTNEAMASQHGLQDRAMAILERVGLADFAHQKPGRLSGGQKQRVAIARALFGKPKIILCDEPTGNLDSITGNGIFEDFARLNRDEGLTFVVVTHQDYVAQKAQRIVRLEDGKVVACGGVNPYQRADGSLPPQGGNMAEEGEVKGSGGADECAHKVTEDRRGHCDDATNLKEECFTG